MFAPYIYRRPVHAVQVDRTNIEALADALPGAALAQGRTILCLPPPPGHTHGLEAYFGDWIVTGPSGNTAVWPDSRFTAVFEAAPAEAPVT